MPVRIYRPTSAGRRNASVNSFAEITKSRPEKSLLKPKLRKSGRNNQGIKTVQGRGGGHKKLYRLIDFKRNDRNDIVGTVVGTEYDPNRSAFIALVEYTDGARRYIIAPAGLQDGDKIVASMNPVEPAVGNCMRLRDIPTGLDVHCVELQPGKGAQFCRSAGMYAKLSNKEDDFATLVLPSGEIRRVSIDCRAVIGQVGNADHAQVIMGKAGKMRHRGRRPKTRGMAKHHGIHPMGGGSGRSKGNRAPSSKTGVPAKGGPTRDKKKFSTKLIIRRRYSKRFGQLH